MSTPRHFVERRPGTISKHFPPSDRFCDFFGIWDLGIEASGGRQPAECE